LVMTGGLQSVPAGDPRKRVEELTALLPRLRGLG
jgi:hypothetical protein